MLVTGSTKPSKPRAGSIIVGVAGGSGSGKTYFAKALVEELGPEVCEVVYQDNFYIDQSHRFDHDGGSVNFDHPDSIDFECLALCLSSLKEGQTTQIPTYDFATHKRLAETLHIKAKPIILVDGILIFHSVPVRSVCDELIFFNTPEDVRYQRRLERDVKERGRTPEGVRAQFEKQVKPMHDLYVEPSKVHARTIVDDAKDFAAALEHYIDRLKKLAVLKTFPPK